MNPVGHWLQLSELHRESAGVPDNWNEKIAVYQHIQCPAIVVCRRVYERVGGFLPQLRYTLDWEMWQRISGNYLFWFEPTILAAYRVHPGSATSRLRLEAADVREVRLTIAQMMPSHPASRAVVLARHSRRTYGALALQNGRELLANGHPAAAWRQVAEALKLSRSGPVLYGAMGILWLQLRILASQVKRKLLRSGAQF
jgi:hypothetical protein